MKFSVVGFLVGAICGLILYGVGTSLVAFASSGLVFGLAALLLWWYITTHWTGPEI
jgi:hypothetical protein